MDRGERRHRTQKETKRRKKLLHEVSSSKPTWQANGWWWGPSLREAHTVYRQNRGIGTDVSEQVSAHMFHKQKPMADRKDPWKKHRNADGNRRAKQYRKIRKNNDTGEDKDYEWHELRD